MLRINKLYFLFFNQTKRRIKILLIDVIKVFQKTKASIYDVIDNNNEIDDDVDDVTMSKVFNNFNEITTIKRCCFEDVLTTFDSKNIFNRFDDVIIYLTIFSYFRTKSTTLSSFNKFLQILYSKSYFFLFD